MFEDIEAGVEISFVIRGGFPRSDVEEIAHRLAMSNCNRPTPFEPRPDASYVDRPIEELESVIRERR
jgi:hypothetical protein